MPKISDLTSVVSVGTADTIPVVQSGTTKKATFLQMIASVFTNAGTNILALVNGGTGSSTAAGARTNLGAAASGANNDITSLSALSTPLSVTQGGTGVTTSTGTGATVRASSPTLTSPTVDSLNGGPLAGLRNRLINAQGLVNQRAYVTGTATGGANQYTLDRWRVVTLGQALSFTTTNNDTTFTAPVGGVEQVIEGKSLESGTYVLSWTGTATATVNGSAITNGGTAVIVGGTDTTIRFTNGTFLKPQFEIGSTATPFERRAYGLEFSLCQRYYEIGAASCLGSAPTAGAQIYTRITYKVTKRATPTFGVGSVAANTNTASTTQYDGNTDSTGYYAVSSATGLVEYRFAWTASSEL